jgi:hypothetical protein
VAPAIKATKLGKGSSEPKKVVAIKEEPGKDKVGGNWDLQDTVATYSNRC